MNIKHKYLLTAALSILTTATYAIPITQPFPPPFFTQPSYNYRNYQSIDYQNYQSIDEAKNDLLNTEANLLYQLSQVRSRVGVIQDFVAAQRSLHLNWVDAKNRDTTKDFHVSVNNKMFSLCQSQFMTGTHPGFVTSNGCLITYGGYSLLRQDYKVLQGKIETSWQPVSSMSDYQFSINQPPTDQSIRIWKNNSFGIQGGFETQAAMFFCKANYNGQDYIGKTVGDNCNIATGGKEMSIKNYSVLYGVKPN